MPKEVFKWETPPPSTVGRPFGAKSKTKPIWVKRLEKLETRPGDWAIVYKSSAASCTTTMAALKRGKPKGVDPKLYEFTTRVVPGQKQELSRKEKKAVIYARYLKPLDPELERLLAEEEEIEAKFQKAKEAEEARLARTHSEEEWEAALRAESHQHLPVQ